MFGSFGCHEDFRCREDFRRREDFRCSHERECKKEEPERVNRNRVCNVLANISPGTEVSLLKLKSNGTFHNLVFEGFCNGIALFSALQKHDKDNKGDKNHNTDTFSGILRVCPEDIIAVAL